MVNETSTKSLAAKWTKKHAETLSDKVMSCHQKHECTSILCIKVLYNRAIIHICLCSDDVSVCKKSTNPLI